MLEAIEYRDSVPKKITETDEQLKKENENLKGQAQDKVKKASLEEKIKALQ